MGRAYTQEQGINGLPADRRITQVRPQRAGAGSSACSPNNYRKDGQYSESSGFEIKPDEQTKRPHWMRGSSTVLPLLSERSFLSMPISHMAYSDESCWNRGRYRSIGMVSAEADCAGELKAELAEILAASDVSEFKWSKLKTAKYRFAAEKMIRVALSQADAGRLRVDVIIWDVEDDRHRLPGRDDAANLGRMYYHLLRNVLTERWPDGSVWKVVPDEQFAPDWEVIGDCLGWKSGDFEPIPNVFDGLGFRLGWCQYFDIDRFVPSSSSKHETIQLADLCAGLGAYSHESYAAYEEWQRRQGGQSVLSFASRSAIELSNADHERCRILACVKRACQKRRWQVSLASSRGLRTYNPNSPFNFWPYEPQHPDDQAPTRSQRTE